MGNPEGNNGGGDDEDCVIRVTTHSVELPWHGRLPVGVYRGRRITPQEAGDRFVIELQPAQLVALGCQYLNEDAARAGMEIDVSKHIADGGVTVIS